MSIKTAAPSTKSRSQKKRESRNERYAQSHTYKAYKSNGRGSHCRGYVYWYIERQC